jgi:CheY-like chemotaxis protein
MGMTQGHILIIDDDPIMQRLMMTVMVKAGYEVRTTSSVHEGLDRIAEQMPDLVLCDMALPLVNGLEFLRHCRSTAELANLPVIIVSSVSDDRRAREALDAGATAHIAKPFSQAELLKIVQDILRSKRRT